MHSFIYRIPECGIFDGTFSVVTQGHALEGGLILQRFYKVPLEICMHNCINYRRCKSMNFENKGDVMCTSGTCELLSREVGEEGARLVSQKGWVHLQTPPEDEIDKVST